MTRAAGEDAIDGIKVDVEGNLYVSGPGGLWILSPDGKHLGTVFAPRHPHNMAWGDADGKTLYLTAQSGLYRMRLNIAGVRPDPQPRAGHAVARIHLLLPALPVFRGRKASSDVVLPRLFVSREPRSSPALARGTRFCGRSAVSARLAKGDGHRVAM